MTTIHCMLDRPQQIILFAAGLLLTLRGWPLIALFDKKARHTQANSRLGMAVYRFIGIALVLMGIYNLSCECFSGQ
jgi:hypothetical protein